MDKDDQFSEDIKSLLGPVVMDMDKNMIATQQSQQDLGQEIDRLIAGRNGCCRHDTLIRPASGLNEWKAYCQQAEEGYEVFDWAVQYEVARWAIRYEVVGWAIRYEVVGWAIRITGSPMQCTVLNIALQYQWCSKLLISLA
ncbi:hypothetical protein [Absidia glauca]|uniref:Uncharacterized protein n=1 Tax=Absidia glauca TaxID=4829 RepID=A0A168RYT0_ABSGL|nr:hypothetical protein [Absidia glauca]